MQSHRWFGLALGLALLPGCGIITVKEAIEQFGPAYCDKLKTCFGDSFDQAFPGGQSDCVAKMKESIPAANLDKTSACTSSEIDDCVKDVQNAQCDSTLDTAKLPTSCQKC